jgi:ankyrin repeat protein
LVKYKAILISLFLSTNLLANDSNNKECLDIFGSFLGVSPENQDIFDIIKAVSKSDITSLEKLLKKGISVNTKDKRGRTLLIKAIIIGSKETVTLLLKHQVDVNLEDKNN